MSNFISIQPDESVALIEHDETVRVTIIGGEKQGIDQSEADRIRTVGIDKFTFDKKTRTLKEKKGKPSGSEVR